MNCAVSYCWATSRASVSAPLRDWSYGEGQEDDEPQQDREAGGQHPEHTCGPVAVLEDAAGRRVAADEQ
jgi:hypothetical protein